MPRTEAEDRAIKKYEREKIDRVLLRMPKGKKEAIQSHIQETCESVNSFINRAINETIERDKNKSNTTE